MDDPIIIAGHSHIAALGLPLYNKGNVALEPLARDGFVGLNRPRMGEDYKFYWDELVRLSENRTVGIVWNGQQHNSSFLLLSEPEFDFILPEHVSKRYGDQNKFLDMNKNFVPFKMVCDNYMSSFSQLEEILLRLFRVPGCTPFLIGTPPPRADRVLEDLFNAKDSWFSEFAKIMNIDLKTVTISSGRFRLKCWIALQFVVEELAAKHKIQFIPAVPSALTSDGFLRDEFARGNNTHANSAYGEIMLDFIKEQLLVGQVQHASV